MAHIHTEIENLRFNKAQCGVDFLINTSLGSRLKEYYFGNKLYATDFFEILFFKKGRGQMWINDKKIELKDNSVVFLSPGQRHCYHLDVEPDDFRFIIFKEDFLLSFLADKYFTFRLHFYYQSSTPPVMQVEERQMARYYNVLEEIEDELHGPLTNVEPVLRSLLYYLLSLLNRTYVQYYDIPATRCDNSLAYQFKEMLERDMHDKQTVASYARQLGVSRVTLNSSVKAQFGLTATELLKNKLIVNIKNDLVETNYSVTYISDKYGFSEPNHMMRFFKKQTGQTIGQFLDEYTKSMSHL